ncbi:MAG: InlB B-repeat-containing protein [Clostridia bacterium]|nr:InlB B-repeat-containing protein [Clostridia bacterium]
MKRFLMYLMTYVLITFSTAFGVVLISDPTKATNTTVNVGGNAQQTEASSPLTYIVDNFTTMQGMNLDATVDVTMNGKPVKILADVTLDLSDGFTNAKAGGTLTLFINNNPVNLDFSYVDGTLYFGLLNGSYKITTNNLITGISQILEIANVELPDLSSMGLDLNNLDITSLLGMFDDIKETKTDTYTTLSLYLPYVANMDIKCDLNYNIQEISLPKTTIDNYTFKLNVKASYPDDCTVSAPENNPIDLTHVFNLAQGMANFVTNNNQIGLNLNVLYNNINLNGDLSLDLENKNVGFKTTFDNKKLNVYLINNVVYVEFENILVKADITRLNEITNLFKNELGLELPVKEIAAAMVVTNQIELNPSTIDLENFNPNTINLGILENFTYENGVYTVVIKDTCTITFEFVNGEFKNIEFVGFDAVAKAESIVPFKLEPNHNPDSYVDVYEAIPALNALLNTLKLEHHTGVISFEINNQPVNVNYELAINNGLSINLNATVCGLPVQATIKNSKIYVSVSDVNIVCNLNELEKLLPLIEKYVNTTETEVDLEQVKQTLDSVLTGSNLLFSVFEETETGLTLEILGKYNLNLTYNELITNIEAIYEDVKFNISVNSNNNSFSVNLNENDFVDVNNVVSLAKNLYTYVAGGNYYFNTTINAHGYKLNGFITIENALSTPSVEAEFNTSVLDKQINLKFVNQVVYLEIDGFNLKFNLTDYEKVVEFIETNFGLDIALVVEDATTALNTTTLPTSLSGLNLKLTNNKFEINYDQANVLLDVTNNKLNSINLNYNNICFNLNVSKKHLITLNETYIDFTTLLPFIKSTLNTAKAGKVQGKLTFIANTEAIQVDFKVEYAPNLQVWLQTNYKGASIKVNLYNNQILMSINEIYLKAGLNDLNKVAEFLNKTFNIEITEQQITQMIGTISLPQTSFALSELNNLVATSNALQLKAFNTNIYVSFENYIKGIIVKTNNVYANIELTKFANGVYMPVINTDAYDTIDYVLEAVSNIYAGIESKNYLVSGEVTLNNFNLPISLQLLANDTLKAKFATTLYEKDLEVVLIGNTIYATIDGFKVKYNLENVNELINLIETTFNLNTTQLTEEIVNTNNVDVNELAKNIYVKTLRKTLTNNGYNLTICILLNGKPVELLAAFDSNNQLTNLTFNYDTLNANLNIAFNQITEISVNETEYATDLHDLTTLVTPINNFVGAKKFEATGTIKLNGFNEEITISNLAVDFSDVSNIKAYALVGVKGYTAEVMLHNNTIYVDAYGLKVYEEIGNVKGLIDWANQTFGLNVEMPQIPNNGDIASTLNKFTLGNLILSMIKTETGLMINLPTYTNENGEVKTQEVVLTYAETLNSAIVNLNGIYAELTFVGFGNNATIGAVDVNQFEHINYVLETIQNVYSNVKQNNLTLSGNVEVENFTLPVTIKLDYSNDVKVKFDTTIYEKQINIALQNNTIYANVDGFKAQYALANVKDLISLIDETFNLTISESLTETTNSFDVNNLSVAKLEKVTTETGYALNLDVTYNEHNIKLSINFNNQNNLTSVNVKYGDMLNATLATAFGNAQLNALTEQEIAKYETNINDLTTIVKPIKNLIDSKQIELSGMFKFDILGDKQTITLTSLKVDYSNLNNISAHAKAQFLGFDVTLAYANETIYVGVDDLKTHIKVNEMQDLIDWVNETFNQNITLPESSEFNFDDVIEIIKKFTLGEVINSITRTPNGIMVNLPAYYNNENIATTQEVVISYLNNNFTNIIVNHELVYAELNFVKFGTEVTAIELTETEKTEFVHYTELTTLIETLEQFVTGKQYAADAQALVYNGEKLRYNVNLGLKIDVTDGLKVDGHANVEGEQDVEFDLDYWNKYLFINYNGLKLKMAETDIKQLIAVVLNVLGVDPSLIPFIEDAADDLNNVNFDSVSGLIPSVDFNNPLSMLNIVSNLSYKNGELTLIIDGSQLSENPNAKKMYFTLNTTNGKLSKLSLTNLYTGVTKNEFFNLNISINDWEDIAGISTTEQATYHDLTGSVELVKAIINTAELNTYHITATVNVVGTIFSGIDIDWDIPLDVQIELDENRKPSIMVSLGEIPTMAVVNKGLFESVKNRMFYIFYRDNYFYLYRTEVNGGDNVEYKLKLHMDDVLADPIYVLQFGTGFTDTIMGAIRDSIENSKNHTPDLGNVLTTYTVTNNTNFNIVLNMKEITNDSKMGDMTINLGVINNESTNNKNYVGNATFKMEMPLASGVFDLALSSDNISLINIGQPVDLSPGYYYMNNYPYGEGEEYIITNGSAKLASLKEYTISFEENGGAEVSDITAIKDAAITLPTYTELRCVVNESAGTRTYYRFEGWYTDPDFTSTNKFTRTTMPRGGAMLYAYWIVDHVDKVVTISFNSNGGSAVDNISEIAGVWIDLSYKVPTKANTYVDKGYNWFNSHAGKWTYEVTSYTFAGWFTDSSLTTKFNGYVPNYNTTLYAKWTSSVTTEYYYDWERP